ncbi:undecaprenyldiphospho-muramoylpentapeptide beta-N-acetylglucosaminyltransferase [bacterium]|nr:MAG: undecaprenyldiphospho-muramoylpentapeptide beta-N-acetylglucosaminyltransferase [bacterium]
MKLVMAGGGTGGHLFPALALAEEFRRRDSSAEIIFVGARGGLEEKVVPKYGYELRLFNVEGIKRRSAARRAVAVFKAAGATLRAVSMLRALKPDGVIGSGSYSSAPVVFAARVLGIKTAILEQNALPGLTNKVLGRVVMKIYIAFPEARGFFPASRTVLSGNPLRRQLLEKLAAKGGGKDAGGNGRDEKFTVFVFGGSQGATAINAAFLDSLEYLADIGAGIRIIHQTGEEGFHLAEAAYRRKKIKAGIYRFIDDMAGAYAASDLVVCRAGATSIAEITAFGLASVLVPYPFAADDHQTVNAKSLEKAGAATVVSQDKLTGRTLADAIRRYYADRAFLKSVSAASRSLGRPDAAGIIADDFTKVLGRG